MSPERVSVGEEGEGHSCRWTENRKQKKVLVMRHSTSDRIIIITTTTTTNVAGKTDLENNVLYWEVNFFFFF